MGLIIDTSIIIAVEKQQISTRDLVLRDEACYIGSVTISELLIGVYRADSEERRIRRSAFVEYIISSIPSLPFGEEEARSYAQIRQSLYIKGITIGTHDLLIGATAISNGHKVLTANERDFVRIPGLEIEVMKIGAK